MKEMSNPFSDPQVVARYVEGPPRAVPGFHDMQRMTRLLLAECAPADARILVLGAGGGLELKLLLKTIRFGRLKASIRLLKCWHWLA